MLLLLAVLGIVVGELCAFYKLISEKMSEGTLNLKALALSVVFLVLAVVVGLRGIDMYPPEVLVAQDSSGIRFVVPEIGEGVEYCLSTDESSEPTWVGYTEGDIVPIERDGTIVRYRGAFLVMRTAAEKVTAHLDEFGRVFIEQPLEVELVSIDATYRERNPEGGASGNTYAGYELRKSDFSVSGEKPSGERTELSGFTFDPPSLTEGENLVKVTYVTASNQELSDTVTVFGTKPRLVSISARLKPELGESIQIGSVLDATMFEVTGFLEGGEQISLDSFEISPTEMVEEGVQTVTIGKEGVSKDLKIAVVGIETVRGAESEDNGSIADANEIHVNAKYAGSLSDSDDVDYYSFRLKSKGKVQVEFQHPKMDGGSSPWRVSLLAQDEESSLAEMWPADTMTETKSSPMRLGPGRYYLKVESSSYSGEKYTLGVTYEEEGDLFETERNDDVGNANPIVANSEEAYTGNLDTDRDVDYYRFSVAEKGKAQLEFGHDKTDSSDTYWDIDILDNTDLEVTSLTSRGRDSLAQTDFIRIPPGEYYVRVNRNTWTDMDYRLVVRFWGEGEEAESEPNDDFGQASSITLGSTKVGNIQGQDDEDFYAFEYGGSGRLELSFGHERTDSDTSWQVCLYGERSGDAVPTSDDRDEFNISGNDQDGASCVWEGLKSGTYYLKVSSWSYSSSDYSLTLAE